MSEGARIAQISRSEGGVPKRAVPAAPVTTLGLEGDVQGNRTIHGGAERALCLFSLERIRVLQAEGHPISPGSIGENLTLALHPAVLAVPRLGSEVVVQVTRYTAPCSFRDHDSARVSQKLHPGDSRVYARVLHEGNVESGDPVRILSDHEASALIGAR